MADHPFFATPPRQMNSDIEASRESSSWVEWGDQFLRHLFSSPLEQYQNGVPSSSAPPPPPPPPPPRYHAPPSTPPPPPPPPSFSSSSSSSPFTVHHATVHHSANMETSPTSHSGHRVADRQAELSAEYQQIEERRKSLAGQLLFIVWEMNSHTKRLKEIESELSAERKRKHEEAHFYDSKKTKVGPSPPPPPPPPPPPGWHQHGAKGLLKIFHPPQD